MSAMAIPAVGLGVRARTRAQARGKGGVAGLTRRGWLALFGLVMALALVAYAVGLAGGAGTTVSYVPTETVVVHQGDSLWTIAQAATAEGEDVRHTLNLIMELNGLSSSSIRGGDVLLVPIK
ncbi:MAG: LysM peptidoglycan-binding domain-containing protein [Bifidobacteriaceae bacterium]|jgi:hypothetical protein|nr:LysM peptidoglycan-binding domain-containing protein [Bifidobacteriaceae bacterium]